MKEEIPFVLDALAFQDQRIDEIEPTREYLCLGNTDQIDSIKLFRFSQLFPSREKRCLRFEIDS
jgi:hypothetical protein